MRVKVFGGDGTKFLGFGELVSKVTVYAIENPDGSLTSLGNAEEKPPEDVVAQSGGRLITIKNNPKIRLESGEIVYGCQIWWDSV